MKSSKFWAIRVSTWLFFLCLLFGCNQTNVVVPVPSGGIITDKDTGLYSGTYYFISTYPNDPKWDRSDSGEVKFYIWKDTIGYYIFTFDQDYYCSPYLSDNGDIYCELDNRSTGEGYFTWIEVHFRHDTLYTGGEYSRYIGDSLVYTRRRIEKLVKK
mgnify:CR=1 FL=1|jgi:hypothetical protein